MKNKHGWGTNPYYYLAGKHGIHPTYIQEMLGDARYDEEDILAVIDHLRAEGGKKFSFNILDGARQFYRGEPRGTWAPATLMKDREVLILGTGPGVAAHRAAIESYIRRAKPLVIALNAQESLQQALIDLRIACHPVRLLADVQSHLALPQPLIIPLTMLPDSIKQALEGKSLLDFGLAVEPDRFVFNSTHCIAPTSFVIGYVLSAAASGMANRILLAGFDGYGAGDARNEEMNYLLHLFMKASDNELLSVTPSVYEINQRSIYAL
jgi:4-hydroxy 2-oxovalerate aldolase